MKSDLMPPAPPTFLKRLPWALGQTPIHTVYIYVILSTVGCSWREHEHLTSLTVAGCEYELSRTSNHGALDSAAHSIPCLIRKSRRMTGALISRLCGVLNAFLMH
jgi:hypothetical protein